MDAGDVIAIDFADDLVAESREAHSDDGTVTLKWMHPAGGGKVELQQARHPSFTDPVSRYRGVETGSVVTGLPEGGHFFRIRAIDLTGRPGPWSAPFAVQVEFMARDRLFLLLGLGGLVVILTVGAIIAGHARTSVD